MLVDEPGTKAHFPHSTVMRSEVFRRDNEAARDGFNETTRKSVKWKNLPGIDKSASRNAKNDDRASDRRNWA